MYGESEILVNPWPRAEPWRRPLIVRVCQEAGVFGECPPGYGASRADRTGVLPRWPEVPCGKWRFGLQTDHCQRLFGLGPAVAAPAAYRDASLSDATVANRRL
jgi:hypothetical protein